MSSDKKPGSGPELESLMGMLEKINTPNQMKDFLEKINTSNQMKGFLDPVIAEFQKKFNLTEEKAHVEIIGFTVASYESKFGPEKTASLLLGAIVGSAIAGRDCTNKDCLIHGDGSSSGQEAQAFGGIEEFMSFLKEKMKKSTS